MTTAQQAADRIHEALGKYDTATNGRDEARAIGLLMTEASPEALRALLAERNELRKALRPFVGATLTDQGHVVGLMREDFERARTVLTKDRT